METKNYSQYGTFTVIIMLPFLLFSLGMLIISGFSSGPMTIIALFLIMIFLIVLSSFYKLTITLDNEYVSFSLGIGLFGKSYKISDIKSCKPVRNSVLYSVGIHMLPNGWLYNVTGREAIELQFNNKKSVVRIGTNQPEEISEIIQRLIGTNINEGINSLENKKQFGPFWIIILLVLIVLLIPIAFIVSGNQETGVQVGNNSLTIKGLYGLTIPFKDFVQIDTVSSLPGIAMRTNGYAFGKTKIGNFRLADNNHVRLFIKDGFKPYILIISKDKSPIYLNFEDRQKTIKLYTDLKNKK